MACLLVVSNGPDKGNISAAKPDGFVFGAMEDKGQHLIKYGNLDKWSDNFVVVELTGMTIEEAEGLVAPVITYADGPIDKITGLPRQIPTYHYNSKGLINFEAMAHTPERVSELTKNRKIRRNVNAVRAQIVERTIG